MWRQMLKVVVLFATLTRYRVQGDAAMQKMMAEIDKGLKNPVSVHIISIQNRIRIIQI